MTKRKQSSVEKSAKAESSAEGQPQVLGGQPCPMCHKNTLELREAERDIPYFGKVFLFSMDCADCNFHKADVETENSGKAIKASFEVSKEDDMKVRVIKSSEATVKIPRITNIEPGPASNGYVTNIEGIFNRVKTQIEKVRENSDDDEEKKKCKNLLKKIRKIMWGEEKITITIEDPSGNSAIVSEKTSLSKMKK